jgi:L,D-transpeptidase YcbB
MGLSRANKFGRLLVIAVVGAGINFSNAETEERAKPLLEKLELSDAREQKLLEELSELQKDGWSWPEKLRRETGAGGALQQFMKEHGFREEELSWIHKLNQQKENGLSTSVALLYTRMLLREGPADFENIWPKWDEGDTPGFEAEEEKRSVTALRELAKDSRDLSALLQQLLPKNHVYRTLQQNYATMSRNIERLKQDFVAIPEIENAKVVNVGDTYAGIPQLKHRLAEEGFLGPGGGAEKENTYTEEISEAVKRYQAHYGRAADGILGPNTLAELNRGPAKELELLRVNLHRARLLPDSPGERHIVVNIPSKRVFVFSGSDKPALAMKAIVGRAVRDRQTPVFRDIMEVLEFGPYWNVPVSIATRDILPKARNDISYLQRNNYELVSNYEASETVTPSSSALSRVSSGDLLIRQKPGQQNALGRVKFLFPNDYAIYLHDTPKGELFEEAERDFSSGCIRVEKPAELAEWVLKPQGWDRSKVEEKLDNAEGERVQVEQPVNVYLVYFTAFPTWDEADKRQVRFYPDIYDRDDKLLAGN